MNVYFRTNLDWYKQIIWPIFENVVPRKGEHVRVPEQFEGFCKHNKLPPLLEVVDITYHQDHVVVELWYRSIDTESAKIDGTLSHLYKQ